MAYSEAHLLLTFGGALAGGEEWQCGLRYRAVSPGTPLDWGAISGSVSLSDIVDDVGTVITNASVPFPSSTNVAWAKLAPIGVNGQYTGEPIIHEDPTPAVGAAGSQRLPNQICHVLSLWTGATLGKGNYGRIYFPSSGVIPAADGRLSAAEQGVLGGLFKSMIDAITGEVHTVADPVLLAIMSQSGAGSSKPVTTVRLGRVHDTQRRRRRGLVEDYADFPLGP